ncbi:S41 family peptidase [Pseudemcibacter aquimaris]|uniref:S41 family peptidase n=1 Tax=Pseudemcibacter aquimaris TaxID=2857064 RepID=UPI002011CC22|nr:S41 family peptidase [Pseudemcibacter aquimaris]MCC3861638.1 S41 family peptidase [Pseudemcibacter aquimaris]WDU58409.1 S41 family peptidase [Pseudemcibacter aquimaris]
MKQFFKTTICAIGIFSIYMSAPSFAAKTETYNQLNLFADVFERIRANYVKDVDDEELIEAAINGMLTSLDPHSTYLNPKRYEGMRVQTSGEFGGLGIEVTMDRGVILVVSPMDDTPAFRAGIKAGDYITRIDGEQINGLTLNEAVEKMRGKVGTDIDVTIVRKGESDVIEITLTRAIIEVQSVRHRIEDEVGYIRVSSFTEKTGPGLREAITEIKEELGDNMQGIVLDLRNNPGGLLDQAVAVSSAFLDRGEIVSTRTRNDRNIQRYNSQRGDSIDGKSLVVLINGGSASASEIVAGALQDHERAVVVGTQSFGKGSVQTVMPLSTNGAMSLTTAYYFTPSGNSIQNEGITPDVVVEQLRLDDTEEVRTRRSEASLRGSLANPNADDEEEGDEEEIDLNLGSEEGEEADSEEESEEEEEQRLTTAQDDYQLNFALNLIRGMSIARSN